MAKVRRMYLNDVKDVAKVALIHRNCFLNDAASLKNSEEWIRANLSAFPRTRYYVAEENSGIAGYILWMEKGGFRQDAVLELEQIGVHNDFRGRGIGTLLIRDSFADVHKEIYGQGRSIKLVEVTTGTENEAQKLYAKTLGAKVEAVLKDFFTGDEAIMIARKMSRTTGS